MQKYVSTVPELASVIKAHSRDLTHDLERSPWALDEIDSYWLLVAALGWVQAHAAERGEAVPQFVATAASLDYETADGTTLRVTRYPSASDGHEPCSVVIEDAARAGGDYESGDTEKRTPDPAGEGVWTAHPLLYPTLKAGDVLMVTDAHWSPYALMQPGQTFRVLSVYPEGVYAVAIGYRDESDPRSYPQLPDGQQVWVSRAATGSMVRLKAR